jgi:hypothetical protein
VVERRPTRHAILLQSPRMLMDLLRIRLTAGRLSPQESTHIAEVGTSPHPSENHCLAPDCDLPRAELSVEFQASRKGSLPNGGS